MSVYIFFIQYILIRFFPPWTPPRYSPFPIPSYIKGRVSLVVMFLDVSLLRMHWVSHGFRPNLLNFVPNQKLSCCITQMPITVSDLSFRKERCVGLMGLKLLAPSWLALWILGAWQGRNFMGKGLGGGKLLIPWQPGSKEADRKDHTETPKDTPLITSPLTTSP